MLLNCCKSNTFIFLSAKTFILFFIIDNFLLMLSLDCRGELSLWISSLPFSSIFSLLFPKVFWESFSVKNYYCCGPIKATETLYVILDYKNKLDLTSTNVCVCRTIFVCLCFSKKNASHPKWTAWPPGTGTDMVVRHVSSSQAHMHACK